MKLLLIVSLFLVGCVSVPVTQEFPSVPDVLTEKCENLTVLKSDAKLSDVAKTVTNNYTLYHKCSAKHEEFVEWYNNQKKIYESVK